jgi:hypothetical protein
VSVALSGDVFFFFLFFFFCSAFAVLVNATIVFVV